jgi:hypothetical protein
MTATERKLDEARYFLEQLQSHQPYFDYILSAFISAARSVPWVMRHEYCRIEDWEKWYRVSSVTEKEKQLLKKTNAWRIAVAKQSGIKTEFNFLDYLIPDETFYPVIDKLLKELPEGEEVRITFRPVSEENSNNDTPDDDDEESDYKIIAKVKMNKDDSEMSRDSIKTVCEEYYYFLKKNVETCTQIFKLG